MLAAPFFDGFLRGFGEAEVDGAGEELFCAVDAARGEEFLGANDAHRVALFRADKILSAFAAGNGKIAGADFPAAGEPGEESGVLIVGVGGDQQRAAGDGEAAQIELGLFRTGELALRAGGRGEERDGEWKRQKENMLEREKSARLSHGYIHLM